MFWNIVLILIDLLGNCCSTGMRMRDLTRASLSIKLVSVIGFSR